jgi:hypothetical protein
MAFNSSHNLSQQDWSIGLEYEIADTDDEKEHRALSTHMKLVEDAYYYLLSNGVSISKEGSSGIVVE